MQVKEIMHNVTKVSPDKNISETARIMDKKVIGSVLIEENGKIVGIMTERDILRKVVAKGKNPDEVKVKDIMSYPIVTIDANDDITEASRKIEQHKISKLTGFGPKSEENILKGLNIFKRKSERVLFWKV